MSFLIDTGVVLRAFDPASPENRPIRQAFRTLSRRQERLIVTVQNIAEFWNVSTRPVDKNGYGLSRETVGRRLATVERICDVTCEDDDSYATWKNLVQTHGIVGVAVHDARLVSVMLSRGISTIITLNAQDFRRYGGITAVLPRDV